MKKRIGIIVTIIIIALVVCLLIWRVWPRSFSNSIPVGENAMTGFSASVRLFNGDVYRIDDTEQQNNTPEEIMEILATSSYRPDFRNLLPWDMGAVYSDKNGDGRWVILSFYHQSEENGFIEITFLSSSIITVINSEEHPGIRVYHPTNHQTMDDLVEYLQTHGAKQ